MGDKQRDRMQSARDCSLWRLVESASKSRRKNDNAGGTQIGCVENWRVASDCAINEMVFADMNGWERCRNRGASEERLDRRARRQTYSGAAKNS